MKIHLDNVHLGSHTGPNVFAIRLVEQLLNLGHDVVSDGRQADVSLVFIEPSGQPLAKRVAQRLDGIWFAAHEFNTKNKNIKSLYERADAVVWQSEFDKGMTTKWWGNPKSGNVIHNGISLQKQEVKSSALLAIRQKYERVFVCSANWHRQKRLEANIQLFDHLRTTYNNSCLFVLGNNPYVRVSHPNVFYGALTPQECLEVYAMSDWMLHLGWCEHCPNTCIEAMSQNTPVVCAETGGAKELVRDFGIILKEQPYNYELYDYDNPPKIDVTQLKALPDKSTLGDHIDIDIRNVVQQYINVFENICCSK